MTTITTPGMHRDMPAGVVRIPVGSHHFATVDAEDADLVYGFHWGLLRGHRGKLYAHRARTYMHRLILGTPSGYETDHVNGDGLDNRRSNLRVATPGQNSANAWKPRRPNGAPHSSRFKGVSWDRSRNLWQAKITIDQLCRNLGRYEDEAMAAMAYNSAAVDAWGEFALVNDTRCAS